MTRRGISGQTAGAIAGAIESGVHGGRMGPGDRLPPVRTLAVQLGVSPATVASAYRLLRGRGLVTAEGRRGTSVAARPPTAAVHHAAVAPPGLIDLASGSPDPALLPPLGAALRSIDTGHRFYGEPPVWPPLAAFAASEFEADGLPAGGVVVTSGGLDAVERVLREHLRPGDRVAIEDPSFPGIRALIHASGWSVLPMAVDEEGPTPEAFGTALERHCRAVIVSPRAQNPTGAALTLSRVADLRQLLRAAPEVLLIENDQAGPVAGVPPVTLCGGSCERWAAVRSTSKFLGPDLRVAVITGDGLTLSRVQGRLALGPRRVSHLLQQLVFGLWSDPSSGRRLARAADVYAQRRAAVLAALRARGIRAGGRSGFNLWLPVPDEARAVRILAEAGWAVAPGERFRIRTPPAIRVTVSALLPEDAPRFAEALGSALAPEAPGYA